MAATVTVCNEMITYLFLTITVIISYESVSIFVLICIHAEAL